ncbi:hypothetical protein OG21DRAFT_1480958 [Imleria badia]|nr:hypothetical protein OG21DRAFT_1480958 [Imleria badia]
MQHRSFTFSGSSTTTPSLAGQAKPTSSIFDGNTQSGYDSLDTTPGPDDTAAGIKIAQAPGTSIFGQPSGTGTTQPQQPTTSTFGQPASGSEQQQQSTTPLFGQPATTPLFGQPATGTQQQPTSSLFGGQSTTGAQQQQSTTSFFGQPAASGTSPFGQGATGTQQPQSTLGTSLFGRTTGTSLFGSTLQPQVTAPATSFGGSTTSSLFGAQSISPAQPTVQVLFSQATKFNDLPEEIKKKFEGLDAHIQGRVQISNDLKQRSLGQEPTKGQGLIRDLRKELLGAAATIQSDALFTKDLKEKTDQVVQDTIIDGFKNPQQHGIYLKNHASFPRRPFELIRPPHLRLEFFTCLTTQMQERLRWYKNTIKQIERKLSSTAVQVQATPQVISSTLQTQHAIFMSLAAKTAAVDAELQKVKVLYTQLWCAKTGSMRDPFNDLDRVSDGDFGIE